MRQNYDYKIFRISAIAQLILIFQLFTCFFFSYNLSARENKFVPISAEVENKVDYLLQIYFSGETKEGINTKILVAIQKIGDNQPTPALAKQLTFLLEIKDKAIAAENACEILDLLAVGIFTIDASEAVQQGVKAPSDKAKAKAGDAMASISKLNNSANNLSNTATNLAWSNYLLSGGKSSSFLSGASTVGNVAGAVGQTGETIKQLGEIGKSLGFSFKKGDKPCKNVAKKEIKIGEHIPVVTATSTNVGASISTNTSNVAVSNIATSTTVINIQGVSLSSLRVLTDTLRNKQGVQSAEKAFNENSSTITVLHDGKTDALADWIADKFSNKFKLLNFDTGKISLAQKNK